VLVLESSAPGGQAGSSSRIENYLGFPMGISGQKLAERAFLQAEKFGAGVDVARVAVGLTCAERTLRVACAGGGVVQDNSIIVATGAANRKLSVPDLQLRGCGGDSEVAGYSEAHGHAGHRREEPLHWRDVSKSEKARSRSMAKESPPTSTAPFRCQIPGELEPGNALATWRSRTSRNICQVC
jgi:hypothetical protein